MPVLQRLFAALMFVLAGCSAPQNPELEFESQRECDTLSLGFDSAGYEMFCHAGTGDGWDPGAGSIQTSYEAIIANATTSYVTIATHKAGNRTYLESRSTRDLISATTWFTETRGWSDSASIEDFEVLHYEGTWEETDGIFKQCASFLRYIGYVTGTPGYKQRIFGTYCIDGDEPVSYDTMSRFLQTVRY